jgi:hypothetical protein
MSLDAALRIGRLAAALERGEALAVDDAAVLATSLRAYLDGAVGSLDAALELRPTAAGQRTWRTRAALPERDAILREAAARLFPKLTATEQAKALETALARYAASAWQRERAMAELPPRHKGRLEECLWQTLRAEPRALGRERIRKILVASSVCS